MKMKNLFVTPKKAAVTVGCLLAALAVLGTGSVFAAGAIAQSTSIGADNAKNFAFADAGVDPVTAQGAQAEFEFKQGQFVYEVEFTSDGTEYDYWIKASDGSVVKKTVEIVGADGSKVSLTAKITADDAKEIALADAGLTFSEVNFKEVKLDREDGVSVYEVEFYTATREYDYEIDATTGAIREKSSEALSNPGNPGTPTNPGAASIDASRAKEIALSDAGVSSSDATFTKTVLDYDGGVLVYEIEFYTATREYDYEIDATTGAIREKSSEALSNPGNPGTPANPGAASVDASRAKEIALSDAGVSSSDATFTKTVLDYDGGVLVYEIEFYTATREYDYEIDATTGAIREKSSEALSNPGNPGTPTNPGAASIDASRAKEIALSDSGVSSSDATFTKTVLDYDGGVLVYEVEFYTATREYDYEIDATTGAIREKSSEPLKNSGNTGTSGNTGSGNTIGVEQAKEIAVRHAGFTVSDVVFSKAKLDHDDGFLVYEIEFLKNGREYEYTVNALTGAILEFESEPHR